MKDKDFRLMPYGKAGGHYRFSVVKRHGLNWKDHFGSRGMAGLKRENSLESVRLLDCICRGFRGNLREKVKL